MKTAYDAVNEFEGDINNSWEYSNPASFYTNIQPLTVEVK